MSNYILEDARLRFVENAMFKNIPISNSGTIHSSVFAFSNLFTE